MIKDKVVTDKKTKMKGGQQKHQITNKVASQTTYHEILVTSNGYFMQDSQAYQPM